MLALDQTLSVPFSLYSPPLLLEEKRLSTIFPVCLFCVRVSVSLCVRVCAVAFQKKCALEEECVCGTNGTVYMFNVGTYDINPGSFPSCRGQDIWL